MPAQRNAAESKGHSGRLTPPSGSHLAGALERTRKDHALASEGRVPESVEEGSWRGLSPGEGQVVRQPWDGWGWGWGRRGPWL